MGIDMSNYKMIYNEQVYNVVGVMPEFEFNTTNEEKRTRKPKFLEVSCIDENGELIFISDETFMFKFVRR